MKKTRSQQHYSNCLRRHDTEPVFLNEWQALYLDLYREATGSYFSDEDIIKEAKQRRRNLLITHPERIVPNYSPEPVIIPTAEHRRYRPPVWTLNPVILDFEI